MGRGWKRILEIPRQSFTRQIIFKTWKSLFQINRYKNIKSERFECHLYGQLIAILLSSSTVFRMRELLLRKSGKELSEYKAVYMIQSYFLSIYNAIQKSTQEVSKILFRLFRLLVQNGRKSRRYEKKTVFDILDAVHHYTTSDKKAA